MLHGGRQTVAVYYLPVICITLKWRNYIYPVFFNVAGEARLVLINKRMENHHVQQSCE